MVSDTHQMTRAAIARVVDVRITPDTPCHTRNGQQSGPIDCWYFREGKPRTFTTMANMPGATLNHG